jgi:hypothetical protein
MGIEVSWDNEERTIIRHTYQGEWTWEEFLAALEKSNTMLDSVNHLVDCIVDMTNSRQILTSSTTSYHKIAAYSQHPNWGVSVLVTKSFLVQTFAGVFTKLYPKFGRKILFASSEEEAYARLAERRHADHR